MGKIRVSTLGSEEAEKEQAEKARKRREAKAQKKAQEETTAGEEKASKADEQEETSDSGRLPPQLRRKKVVGKNITKAKKQVEEDKEYSLEDALKLIKKMSYVNFDETIELHANLKSKGLKGEVTLPHGTGKEINIAIADDKVLSAIEAGKIDFDILISTPDMMPEVMKHARVLGPKGLMPNPKNGTVSDDPKTAAKKLKGGSFHFKGEPKFPLLHQAVGKKSFTDKQLTENIKELLKAVNMKNVTDVYLSGSMTPSVKVQLESL